MDQVLVARVAWSDIGLSESDMGLCQVAEGSEKTCCEFLLLGLWGSYKQMLKHPSVFASFEEARGRPKDFHIYLESFALGGGPAGCAVGV